MAFSDISRQSLERLSLSYRSEGVLPGPYPPARGNAPAANNPQLPVASEAFRALPFLEIPADTETFARHYQLVAGGAAAGTRIHLPWRCYALGSRHYQCFRGGV